MKIKKIHIKNYRSIQDSGDILFTDNLFVLAGQNESGKSSILEAISSFEKNHSERDNLNFEYENRGDLIQEISITYSDLDDDFFLDISDEVFKLISKHFVGLDELKKDSVIIESSLKKLKEFTLKKTFDFNNGSLEIVNVIDPVSIGVVSKCFGKLNFERIGSDGTVQVVQEACINIEDHLEDLFDIFWQASPAILLFNDFLSILPDKILLDQIDDDNIQGIQAVRNISKLLKLSFKEIAQKSTPQKNSSSQFESEILSASFQMDWQQKIYDDNKVNISFCVENNTDGKMEISFFVETKDNEYLSPRRRSKGMIWFLSLWLELKAMEDSRNMLLLFDEPGLHLHVKANRDMLAVFHKLISKGHQVIYSTHIPSLIEVERLHNIGLVINTIEGGTTVEGLTSAKFNSSNKRDALQPISEAMGLEPFRDFSHFKQRNVIVEGLSDFWILKGMVKLLSRTSDYEFIPALGIKDSKVLPLISFCIGYGFDWLLIIDGGENPKKLKKLLKETYFQNDVDLTDSKVFLSDKDEIENMFNIKDLSKLDSTLSIDKSKSPIENIGKKRKIIFSKTFYSKVLDGYLSKSDLDSSTITEFEKIFDWIDMQFNN
jgi:predicted ATPase